MKYCTLLLLLILPIMQVVQADVYRSVDEHGTVIFSDAQTDNAEKIELQESYIYTPPVITDLTEHESVGSPVEIEQPSYTLTIVAPTQNEALRENAGNVMISITITPALNVERGDKLIFSLDGQITSEPQDVTSYMFTNVDRGSHIALVSVVDKTNQVLKTSKSILFHVQRISVN